MLRNLVTSLLDHERVETTDAKAKAVRRLADRMITLGKRGDLHARRQALSVVRSRQTTAKLFDELADRFRERPGGYTRVLKTRRRTGDAAPLSIVELVEAFEPPAPEPKKKEASKKASAKAGAEDGGKKASKKKTSKKAGKKKASAKASE